MVLLFLLLAPSPLEAVFCKDVAEPCRIVESRDAGRGASGVPMRIHEVLIDNAPGAEDDFFACRPGIRAFWLEWVETDKPPVLLMQLCNDGYGASGVGEDFITISENSLVWSQMGGSAWRWDMTYDVSLDPFEVRRENSCGWHALSSEWSARRWNWETFSGAGAHHNMACASDGTPLEEDFTIGDCGTGDPEGDYVLIPKLNAFPEGAFALGSCAALIDSSGQRGFVVHGAPGAAEDATMRVVTAGEGDYIIEITDDTWIETASSWVKEDHLEFWVSGGGAGAFCGNLAPPVQYAVTRRGEVIPASGTATSPPTAEITMLGDIWHIRLKFAEPQGYLSVIYSDSDDGKAQERLIATSDFRYGNGETLGDAYFVDAAGSACEIRDGKLEATGLPAASRVVPSANVR